MREMESSSILCQARQQTCKLWRYGVVELGYRLVYERHREAVFFLPGLKA